MMYMQSKLFPRHMAQVRRAAVAWMTLPFRVSEAFWTTWSSVMFPEGEKA